MDTSSDPGPLIAAREDDGAMAAVGGGPVRRVSVLPVALGIFALAVGLRLLHLWVLRARYPELVDHPVGDAAHYHQWAKDILAGAGLANRTYFMHPVLPIFAAVVYFLTGPVPVAVAIAECLLAGMGIVLWWKVLQRYLQPREALLAVVLMAIYRPLVLQSSFLETAELAMFFLALALYAAVVVTERRPRWGWFVAGVFLVIAGLGRGNILMLLPVFAWMAWRRRDPLRDRWRQAFWSFALGATLVVGLVGVRNRWIGKEWVWTTSSLGPVLYLSNHPDNVEGGHVPPSFLRPEPRYEETDWRAEAVRRMGRRLSASEVSDFWRQRALAALAEHPWFSVQRFLRKLGLAWASYELADSYNPAYIGSLLWLRWLPLPGFSWIAGLACFGIAAGWSRRRQLGPLFGWLSAYWGSMGVFYVSSRMRIVMVPFLCAFVGVGFFAAWDALRNRSWVWVVTLIAVVVPVTVLANRQVPPRTRELEWSQALNLHAVSCDEAGQTAQAGELRERAVRLDPENPFLRVNIGLAALRAGDAVGAAQACGIAVQWRDSLSNAHDCLGIALAMMGKGEAAEKELRRAVELDPEQRSAFNLAVFLIKTGRQDEGVRILEEILQQEPGHEDARHALGLVKKQEGARAGTGRY
jgi:4-amino-4-deoxy-L-arabinose transferase-like glycosyltransferase